MQILRKINEGHFTSEIFLGTLDMEYPDIFKLLVAKKNNCRKMNAVEASFVESIHTDTFLHILWFTHHLNI